MHAYMIIAHNQFELLEKLIKALDDERNDIYIHIDKKVRDFDFARFSALTAHSRVLFTDERVSVTWGDFSQVKTEMLLLKTAVSYERADQPYRYFHLVSGVDFPIKSNDEIHRFFEEHQGMEFVHYSDVPVAGISVARLKYYHFFRKKRNLMNKILAQIVLKIQVLFKVNRLKKSHLSVQKGCNWFSITDALAHYIVSRLEQLEPSFRYSYCGDETFVQTVIESAEEDFKDRLFMPDCHNNHDACLRLIDWERGNPYVWRSEDFEMIKSSPCIFARKFDLNTDAAVIERIERELLHKG